MGAGTSLPRGGGGTRVLWQMTGVTSAVCTQKLSGTLEGLQEGWEKIDRGWLSSGDDFTLLRMKRTPDLPSCADGATGPVWNIPKMCAQMPHLR